MNPKISLIMLVHNREDLVEKTIQCAINQDFKSYEFIIIDNGSTDNSYQICSKYTHYPHIKLFQRNDKSISKGRNKGIECATGEYVVFIDDDDLFEEDLLSFLYQLVREFDAEGAICGSNKIVDGSIVSNCVFDGRFVMNPEEAIIELLTRKKMNAALPTKIFKRELFQQIKFCEQGKYDDITFTYKIMAQANRIAADGTPKYTFYRHENNHSNFTTNDKLLRPGQLNEYLKAFRERTLYLSNKMVGLSEFVQYTEWSYMISMCNKIITNDLQICSNELDAMKYTLKANYMTFFESRYIKDFEKEWMLKYIAK